MRTNENPRLLDIRQLSELLAISRAKIWGDIKANKLPKPIYLGRRSARWRLGDIEKYINKLAKASRR